MTGAGKQFYDKLSITHDFTMNVIQERKKTRAEEKLINEENLEKRKRRQAFLDLLLEVNEQNSDMTMEDVLAEVNTFMFAVCTISFLFEYYCANYSLFRATIPQVQRSLSLCLPSATTSPYRKRS